MGLDPLVDGLALAAIGICLLLGQVRALMAGMVVAAISAVINFTCGLVDRPLGAVAAGKGLVRPEA